MHAKRGMLRARGAWKEAASRAGREAVFTRRRGPGVTGSEVSSWLAKRSTVSLTVQENMSAAEPRSD
jgi:hypothetical protein